MLKIGLGGNPPSLGRAANAVKYTEQTLTDSQKSQARTNIGAIALTDVPVDIYTAEYDSDDPTQSTPYTDVLAAYTAGKRMQVKAGYDYFPLTSAESNEFCFTGLDAEGVAQKLVCGSSGWTVTEKTFGTYSKPVSGIPASDLATAVQNALAPEIIYGYLYEGAFYVESTHTTLITASTSRQYIDMTTATAPKQYSYNGTAYVAMGGGDTDELEEILSNAIMDIVTHNDLVEEIASNAILNLHRDNFKSENIAPAYDKDNSEGYAVGSYVTYKNLLYRCTTAVTGAELFDATKWTQTSVMAEIVAALNQ